MLAVSPAEHCEVRMVRMVREKKKLEAKVDGEGGRGEASIVVCVLSLFLLWAAQDKNVEQW